MAEVITEPIEKSNIPVADFVHLHMHSQYSLLDGACRIKQAIKTAQGYGIPAVAVTDHGNLFGAMELYKSCKKENIKPIIGCEMYVAPHSRFDTKSGVEEATKERNYHLILLAKNANGYKNLSILSSKAYLEGFYYKPRIDWELLEQHHDDLICLTACMQGEVPNLLLNSRDNEAYQKAARLAEMFGPNNFYLEIQDNGYEEQITINRKLLALSKKMNLPLVATNDCHYLKKEDAELHDILLCVQTGKTLDDPNRLRFRHDSFYYKSPDEMKTAFKDIPEAILNTRAIAEMVDIKLTYDGYLLPNYAVPDGYNLNSYLEELVWQGLKQRFQSITPEIEVRTKYELGVITDMGFAGYFLIVWDFIHHARQQGIPVGPGRGSAAGSIVAYSLGITQIDPLKYGLIFERFLNPSRISMPDIDVDFCYVRRGEVIDYVTEKYGRDSVCQIITFGTMAAKNAIRDVGRAMNVPLAEVDKLAKLIPNGPGWTIDKAINESSELKKLYGDNETYKQVLTAAKWLEGSPRHASTHAAGVVISPSELTNYVPLYRPPGTEDITTQFEMGTVADEIKLLKMDFLGLRTLTVVYDTAKLVKKRRGIELDLHDLPLDDPQVYELLTRADTDGVFQLESNGMRDLLKRLAPSNFEDISAVIALYRPGPLGSGMIDIFIDCRHGRKPIEYPHPSLKEILQNTYGVMVYQEQVMQISSVLSGFTMAEADKLRKAMGKKKPEEMAKLEAQFIDGAQKNNVKKEQAQYIWDLMVKFAGYGFNKSHTVAYALVAFQTAYLKAHYPVEFMASLLTSEIGNQDKMVGYIKACRKMGLKVLPPDINASYRNFTVIDDQTIRFGLGAVKNVGEAAIESILNNRKKNKFTDLYDFCLRNDSSKINSKVIESLIKCGAFDGFGANRAQMLAVLPAALEQGAIHQKDEERGQGSLFDLFEEASPETNQQPQYPPIQEFSQHEILQFERDLLGFYVSGHPLQQYESVVEHYTDADAIRLQSNAEPYIGKNVSLAGIIIDKKVKKSKKGNPFLIITLEDFTGHHDIRVFQDIEKYVGILEKDKLVHIVGRVDSFNDNVNITLQAAILLDQVVDKLTSSFHVRVSSGGTDPEKLEQLQKLLRHYSGPNRFFMDITTPTTSGNYQVTIMTDLENCVQYSPQLLNQAGDLFGRENVWFSNKG